MVLEYIVEDSKYKELIKGEIPKKGKKGAIKTTSKKFSGINNYILTIEYCGSLIDSAETLSNIAQKVKKTFDCNNVKYYILRDEASIAFANRLYPLVCEFETKLRKFLYIALFDLDESAKKLTTNKIKTAAQRFSKVEKVPQNNFLEDITLGEVFTLLFDNKEFLDAAKEETKRIENTISRKATKKELIEVLEKIEEKTLWNELFCPSFSEFDLLSAHEKLFTIRNDVMHFHFISYEQYTKALKLLRETNNNLDTQLAKGIVLENNEDNVALVSNNYQYTFKALSTLAETIQTINERLSTAMIPSITPLIGALAAFNGEWSGTISETMSNTVAALGGLYGMTNLYDLPGEAGNTNDSDAQDDAPEETNEE